ncbi:acetyltransferase [Vibrio tarriae]|nr:acetyltransferase [Vibrio tarriae]
MVTVVVFEFSGMRCQPLRRALYDLGGKYVENRSY